jgi:hypothetical protein
MANTFTQTVSTVWGDKRVLLGTVTANDGIGTEAETGLNSVDLVLSVGPGSADWGNSGGAIGPLTATSGDVFQVMVIGN